MNYKSNNKLTFFHLPKTGGTSVAYYLKDYFEPNAIFQQEDDEKIEDMPESQIQSFDFISGHFSPASHIGKFTDGRVSCLMLRSPLEHLRSIYFHTQTINSGAEFYDPDIVQLALQNPFSEFLFKGTTIYFTKLFDNPQIRFILDLEDEEITLEHYEHAVSTIKKIDVVGTTERMQAFMHAVKNKLGVDMDRRPIPRIRTSFAKNSIYELDQESILSILRRSVYDMKLYQYVLQNIIDRQEATTSVEFVESSLGGIEENEDCINVFDHVLSPTTRVENATLGVEVMVTMTDIVMHPPLSNNGKSKLIISNINFDGHNKFVSHVSVPAPDGPTVMFSFSIMKKSDIVITDQIEIVGGKSSPFMISFDNVYGLYDIILETSVPEGMSINNGHARFISPKICKCYTDKS